MSDWPHVCDCDLPHAVLLYDDDTAVERLAVKLTAIIEARMSRDLAWTRDDGVNVERWDPEKVGWALAHLAVAALREGGQRK